MAWTVDVDGLVDHPLVLPMADIRSRPAVTRPVTMECAGNGRALMPPRAESQPWLLEAVGNAEWTGTPLPPILEEAGLRPDALELVFTGADHGIQGEVEQDYQWGFSLADIVKDDVLLAYELNGQPLPPQHGYPIRRCWCRTGTGCAASSGSAGSRPSPSPSTASSSPRTSAVRSRTAPASA